MFHPLRRYFYQPSARAVPNKETIENSVDVNKSIIIEKKEEKKKEIAELKNMLANRLDKIEELFGNYKDPLLKINESIEEIKKIELLNKKQKREKKETEKVEKISKTEKNKKINEKNKIINTKIDIEENSKINDETKIIPDN